MLSKAQYRFIFNSLQDVIFKDSRRPGIEIESGFTWYIFEFFAFSEKGIAEDNFLFNKSMFSDYKFADAFRSRSVGAPLLHDTSELKIIRLGSKDIKIRKFVSVDGDVSWVREEAVKLLPPDVYEYRGRANETYCLIDGELRGYSMNYKLREEQ